MLTISGFQENFFILREGKIGKVEGINTRKFSI